MWQKTLIKPVVVGLALLSVGCSAQPVAVGEAMDPPVLAVGQSPTLHQILDRLPDDRIVYVGETHDRYDHHLVQLEVLKFLHKKYGDVALGVEWFQFPFQRVLDDYVAGRITEAQMLARSGYFDRWRFDYRLYRPIMRYARDNGIPIVALNAPVELTRKIGQDGLASLPEVERKQLPADYASVDETYRKRVRAAFDAHPPQGQRFEHFLEVMQTWDESMAQHVTDAVAAHPGRRMVVLAGSGHVMFGDGIPARVEQRAGIRGTRLLVGAEMAGEPGVADFLVLSQPQALPPAGMLGAFLDGGDKGLTVKGVSDDSGLKAAGIEAGDVLLALDDTPTPDFATLKLALLDKAPGDTVRVRYRRDRLLGGEADKAVVVTLGGDAPAAHRK
jgi:uncharacterized iron-regulated protein